VFSRGVTTSWPGTLGLRRGSARHARTIPAPWERPGTSLVSYPRRRAARPAQRLIATMPRTARTTCWPARKSALRRQLDPVHCPRCWAAPAHSHEVICVEHGNKVEGVPTGRTILQMADQLVIKQRCRARMPPSPPTGFETCSTTRALAISPRTAVTLCPSRRADAVAVCCQISRRICATRTRAVAVVPYDPILETGSSIDTPSWRRHAAAVVFAAAGVIPSRFVR